MAAPTLATSCFVADGNIIDRPGAIWLKEAERLLLLNPGDVEAEVELITYRGLYPGLHRIMVPPRRLKSIAMENLVTCSGRYGVRINSSVPIIARWQRNLGWYDSNELMSYGSISCVPVANTSNRIYG